MLAAAVLAADIAATLDLSDRSDVRVRATQQTPAPIVAAGTTTGPVGLDVLTQPDVRLQVLAHEWELRAGYTATVVAPDLELGFTPQVLQVLSAGVGWHDRRLHLTLQEDAAYGLQNSSYLTATTPATSTGTGTGTAAPVVPLATAPPVTITYGSTRTAGGLVYRIDRLSSLALGAEYFITGGLDATSQATLPEQFGERALATYEHGVTRSDVLVTAATAQHIDFSQTPCVPASGVIDPTVLCAPGDELLQVVERVRHALSRAETLTVGAGVAVAGLREQLGASYGYSVYPVGDASYTRQLTREGRIGVTARLAPYIDPRTGIVLNALQGDVSVVEHFTKPLTLTVSAGGSQNLPTGAPAAASIVRGEVALEYRVGPRLLLTLGERGFWESENGLGNFTTAMGYVAVTVREPTLHF